MPVVTRMLVLALSADAACIKRQSQQLTRSVEYMYVSAMNMSKSCCFAFLLAVICLSLEADAQPTVDETMTCGSSTLEDVVNMVTVIASNQQDNAEEIRDEIRDVKQLLTSNPTDHVTTEPSKQALVSALVCEYLVCFQFDNNGSMEITHALLL